MLVPSSYWGFVKIYTTDAERVEVGIMMPHDLETRRQQSQESMTQTHHAEAGKIPKKKNAPHLITSVFTFTHVYTRAVELNASGYLTHLIPHI